MNNPSWRHWLKETGGFISTAFIYLWCAVHMLTNLVVNMFSWHWTWCRNPKSTLLCNTCPKDHWGIRRHTRAVDRRLSLASIYFLAVNHSECENCFFVLSLCCKKSYETVKAGDNFTPYNFKKKSLQMRENFCSDSISSTSYNGTQCAMPYA